MARHCLPAVRERERLSTQAPNTYLPAYLPGAGVAREISDDKTSPPDPEKESVSECHGLEDRCREISRWSLPPAPNPRHPHINLVRCLSYLRPKKNKKI